MTSLLCYQHFSNLSEDERIEIDKEVKKNREEVYFFIRELPSNSRRKVKRLLLRLMVIFEVGQPLVSFAVMVPLPPTTS